MLLSTQELFNFPLYKLKLKLKQGGAINVPVHVRHDDITVTLSCYPNGYQGGLNDVTEGMRFIQKF